MRGVHQKSKVCQLWFLNIEDSEMGLFKLMGLSMIVIFLIGSGIGISQDLLQNIGDWAKLTISSFVVGMAFGMILFMIFFIVTELFE
jgi:hypothetical protein